MTTTPSKTDTKTAAADTWRDVWVDPDTARINARMAEVRHTAEDMADFYREARNAIS